jgi:hypothetical protein
MIVGADNDPDAAWHGGTANAGDKRSRLRRADADCVGLADNTQVPDIDIVAARGEIDPGSIAQCDVVAAGCVKKERQCTGGRVEAAGCVVLERTSAVGRWPLARLNRKELPPGRKPTGSDAQRPSPKGGLSA